MDGTRLGKVLFVARPASQAKYKGCVCIFVLRVCLRLDMNFHVKHGPV